MRQMLLTMKRHLKHESTHIRVFTKQNQMRHNLNDTQLNTKQFKYEKQLNMK